MLLHILRLIFLILYLFTYSLFKKKGRSFLNDPGVNYLNNREILGSSKLLFDFFNNPSN
jgi:hypothetical protein